MEGNILGVGRAAGSNALTVGQEQATASVMDAIGQAALAFCAARRRLSDCARSCTAS